MLDSGLAGKTCLITGASIGIGFGIARTLAGEGVRLAVASRNPDLKNVEELNKLSGHAIAIRADVSTEQGAVGMVEQAIKELGHLDMYVNNSAMTWHQPITKITAEAFYATLNTNLAGPVFAIRTAARHMIERRSGSILIVNSTVRFNAAFKETSYRISKMGLKMFMDTLAIELAPFGIRVNLLTPGHFPTKMTSGIPEEINEKLRSEIPLHCFGKIEQCGPAAVLLLSDKLSGYTTGSDIVIDGGLSLRPLRFFPEEEIKKWNLPD